MWKTVIVREHERAILVRDGRIAQVLEPGKHQFLDLAKRLITEIFDIRDPLFKSNWGEVLERAQIDLTSGRLITVRVAPGEVAVISYDGLPALVAGPGEVLRFWSELKTVTVRKIDVADAPRLARADVAALETVPASGRRALIQIVEIAQHEVGLLFLDGELVEELKPGRHGFWLVGRTVRVQKIDTRPTPVEITAQEILTKDRVSVRLTLTAFLKVTEAKTAALATPNFTEHVYKLVQFAVREAVARRTLDEVLNDRESVDGEIVGHVRETLGDIGVAVTELGIKDVILPGDMRELINKVVEAEKIAQANIIRRREETAATRSLLNTARLMEESPTLLRLKELEALERVTEKVGRIDLHAGAGQGLDALLTSLVRLRERDEPERSGA